MYIKDDKERKTVNCDDLAVEIMLVSHEYGELVIENKDISYFSLKQGVFENELIVTIENPAFNLHNFLEGYAKVKIYAGYNEEDGSEVVDGFEFEHDEMTVTLIETAFVPQPNFTHVVRVKMVSDV